MDRNEDGYITLTLEEYNRLVTDSYALDLILHSDSTYTKLDDGLIGLIRSAHGINRTEEK